MRVTDDLARRVYGWEYDTVLETAACRVSMCDLAADLLEARAERDALKSRLEMPCGSCHSCENWNGEEWRRAGRKPPHPMHYDKLVADVERLFNLAYPDGAAGDAGWPVSKLLQEREAHQREVERLKAENNGLSYLNTANVARVCADNERLRGALRDLVYTPIGAGDEEQLARSERWHNARRALADKG